jgi:hypothetical protein
MPHHADQVFAPPSILLDASDHAPAAMALAKIFRHSFKFNLRAI